MKEGTPLSYKRYLAPFLARGLEEGPGRLQLPCFVSAIRLEPHSCAIIPYMGLLDKGTQLRRLRLAVSTRPTNP